jgi:hypothetical protein
MTKTLMLWLVVEKEERKISELPAKQREPLVLTFYEGLSAREISEQIKRPERTVLRHEIYSSNNAAQGFCDQGGGVMKIIAFIKEEDVI